MRSLGDCVSLCETNVLTMANLWPKGNLSMQVILATHCVTCGEDGDLLPCREHPECCLGVHKPSAQGFSPVMGSDAYGNPMVNTIAAIAEYRSAYAVRDDAWVVGAVGTEQPFVRGGRWYLYVHNPASGRNGYLDLATDVVYDDMWNWTVV